jgi:CHAT domain-containing protein/Tfp pilus assembly protein PilF
LNGISEFSKLLLVGLGKRAKAQKGIAIVLFTIACILGSAFPLPLIFFSGSSTAIAQTSGGRSPEGDQLFEQGKQHYRIGQFQAALESLQQALRIYQDIGDRRGEALALNGIGITYADIQQSARALEYLHQALAIFTELGDRFEQGTALSNIGSIYSDLRQYERALEYLQQALVIRQETGDRAGEWTTLNSIAIAYSGLGQSRQALEFYQQALTSLRAIGDHVDRIGERIILQNVGEVYTKLGQYAQALEALQQALTMNRAVGDRLREAAALNNIGFIYVNLGQYAQGLEHYQQALAISIEMGDRIREAATLDNMGGVYDSTGQYSQALEFYQQALAIRKEVGDWEGEANTLNGIGLVYSNLGQYTQALDHLQQALVITRNAGNRVEEGTTLNNIGGVYISLGQYVQALEYYQRALAISRDIGDRVREVASLNGIGAIHQSLGQYAQVLEYYQQALAISREIGIPAGEGAILSNIGVNYQDLGQYAQALEYLQQALTITRAIGDRAGEGMTLGTIGLTSLLSKQFVAAEEQLFASLNVLESLRAFELKDSDKVALFDTQLGNYLALQQVLIAQNKTELALEVAERGRARPFVELLATRLSEAQVTKIVSHAADLAAIRRIAQKQNATLVQYTVINSRLMIEPVLYIWVIHPTGEIHFQSVNLTTLDQSLSDLVTSSRDAIGVRNRSEPAAIVPELKPEAQQRQQAQQRQKLQQLHQLLIEPIAQWLPTNPDERVIFIPQGELFLVPFPALVDAQGDYLIKKHTIVTAPSIQVLDLTRQQRQSIGANSGSPIRGDDLLVVGNPIMPRVWNPANGIEEQLSSLPGAEEEAVTIAKMFATQPMLWEQASESAVVQRMPQARIIHLSTHGLLEYGNPEDSGVRDVPGAIALSPSAKDDGLLTSAEILKMKLKAELVVLSACDTGRGKITGDGVIGLSRSLITAGVPSVIVSLWSVPDAPTAELMSEFYRQWQQNPDKAKALRQAMLITMQNHPNPRDWAAFTLIGESE